MKLVQIGETVSVTGANFQSTITYSCSLELSSSKRLFYAPATFVSSTQLDCTVASVVTDSNILMSGCGEMVFRDSYGHSIRALTVAAKSAVTTCLFSDMRFDTQSPVSLPFSSSAYSQSLTFNLTADTYNQVFQSGTLFTHISTFQVLYDELASTQTCAFQSNSE